MFESLSESFQNVLRKISGKGRITQSNIEEGVREVQRALLSADVNFKVVKDFTAKVSAKCVGLEVVKGVEPWQQFIKIINDELVALMGPVDPAIPFQTKGPTIVMMVGLQGSGKTTTTAKLARLVTKKGRKVMLVAADVVRPAAIEQLRVLGKQHNFPVYSEDGAKPLKISQRALAAAEQQGLDTIIIDTQGRLHIDEVMMDELKELKEKIKPHQIYLVVDAMTGQDAVKSAGKFNEALGIDAVILTKLDGDARGGAALSVKAVTGKPIKFVGMGEKIDNLEEFYPDRMASRILGLGDVVSLVEKAQEHVDVKQAAQMRDKMLKGEMTFDDWYAQLQTVKKMGSLKDLIKMIPGVGQALAGQDIDEGELKRVEAVITSMTKQERKNPEMLANVSRKQRIAKGSGVSLHEVNQILKQFEMMRGMMRDLKKGKGDIGKMFRDLQ